MTSTEKLTVEPISFSVKGIKLDDFISKEFLSELRKELPEAVADGLIFYFPEGEHHVQITPRSIHDGELVLEPVDIEGDDPRLTATVMNVVKKVFG